MNKHDRRFSPAAFQRYQPYLAEVVKHFPNPYIFTPTNLSRETVINRIRDAAKAFIHFNYPSTISHAQFSTIWPKVIVRAEGERSVFIGTLAQSTLTTLEAKQTPKEISVYQPTPEITSAIATLLNVEILKQPYRLVSPTHTPDLSNYPNVELYKDGEDIILL